MYFFFEDVCYYFFKVTDLLLFYLLWKEKEQKISQKIHTENKYCNHMAYETTILSHYEQDPNFIMKLMTPPKMGFFLPVLTFTRLNGVGNLISWNWVPNEAVGASILLRRIKMMIFLHYCWLVRPAFVFDHWN